MNRIRTVLILLITGFLIWTLFFKERSSESPIETPNVVPSPPVREHVTQKAVPRKPVEIKQVVPGPSPLPASAKAGRGVVTARDSHKPPPKSVPFDLINGWVVAYGDILIGKPTRPDFPASGFIEAPAARYWQSATIPFSIHASLPNPERVLRAIAYINANTPVRFIPYSGQADNIVFAPMDDLCMSYLGKIGGNQPIYLDVSCGEHEITHEILHALGFIHEHSRPDRDSYIEVNWDNIAPDKQRQFMVVPDSLQDELSRRPFDYNSVMLYSKDIFALDRSVSTLQSKTGTEIAPVLSGLSPEDIARLVLIYNGR